MTNSKAIPDDWQRPLCGLSKSDLRPLPRMMAPVQTAARIQRTGGDTCRAGEERQVGFVLSGRHADDGMSLYRELFALSA